MIGQPEKYSDYDFEIFEHIDDDDPRSKHYTYQIYTNVIRESANSYDTYQEARFAAIGHITLLENNDGSAGKY